MDNLIIFYGLLFVIIVNLILSIFILSKSRGIRNRTNALFGFISLGVVIWSLAMLGFYFLKGYFSSRIWILLTHSSAAFIALVFLYFTLYFPSRIKISRFLNSVVFLVFGAIIFLLFFSNTIIGNAINGEYEIGRGYIFYAFYIILYFALGYLNLFVQYRKATDSTQKAQVMYILLGSVFASIPATLTDLAFPYFGIFQYTWLGPFFTLLLVVALAVAILKHHLFDIKVIASEFFTTALLLVLFSNLLASKNDLWFWINALVFVLALVFGVLLIKSVLKEVATKKELEKAYKTLKRIDEAKSEFLSMASHQLRTPLTSVKGYVSMLLEGDYGELKKEQKKVLENVLHSNERLIKMVNELLSISRIQLGKIKIQKEETQIEELIQSCYQEMAFEAEKKKLKISFKKPEHPLPKIYVDQLKLRQVILNLIDNAIRYTQKGKIDIEIKRKDSKIQVLVKDTGEGLTKKEQKEIFSSFTRGTAGVNFFVEGSGLGLYVAKKYIDLHKGRIWAESSGKGKGSTFYIELPIEPQLPA